MRFDEHGVRMKRIILVEDSSDCLAAQQALIGQVRADSLVVGAGE